MLQWVSGAIVLQRISGVSVTMSLWSNSKVSGVIVLQRVSGVTVSLTMV